MRLAITAQQLRPPVERDPHDAKRIADYVNIIINLANYLVPEEDKPSDEFCCPPVYSMLWDQRMQFRALLTTEAERAERGELFWEQKMRLRAWVSAQAERAKTKFFRRGSNPPPPSRKPEPPASPPAKPQPSGGRLIYEDRLDPLELPVRLDEGRIQRGNRSGGPTGPKPKIIPKPQFPPPRKILEGFLPHSRQRSPMTNTPSPAKRRALFEQVLLQKEWHSLSQSSIPPDAVIRAAVEVVLGDPVQDATCPTAARYRAEFLALAEAIDLSPLP